MLVPLNRMAGYDYLYLEGGVNQPGIDLPPIDERARTSFDLICDSNLMDYEKGGLSRVLL